MVVSRVSLTVVTRSPWSSRMVLSPSTRRSRQRPRRRAIATVLDGPRPLVGSGQLVACSAWTWLIAAARIRRRSPCWSFSSRAVIAVLRRSTYQLASLSQQDETVAGVVAPSSTKTAFCVIPTRSSLTWGGGGGLGGPPKRPGGE